MRSRVRKRLNCGLVVVLDDGEYGEDVGVVVSVDGVQVDVEGVEAGSEVAAGFLVPGEGWAVVAEVAGEGGEVVRGVGGAEAMFGEQSRQFVGPAE